MTPSYDVIIVGLGAMGSAAAYQLAGRGARVLGLDRFAPPHTLGSTHGRTRVIREAYFEHPLYVPLVQRAYELWDELTRESGRTLLVQTGGLMMGPADGALVAGARESAERHHLPHAMLDAGDVARRFPPIRVPEGEVALLEPRAGLLFPEACVEEALDGARRRGAELRTGEEVTGWRADGGADGDGVEVTTDAGTYRASRLVLAAGPWNPELLARERTAAPLALPLEVERQLFHWFEPVRDAELLDAEVCPVVLWEFEHERIVAFLPDTGDGVKVGIHHGGEITTPDTVRREPTADDEAAVRALLARVLPSANGRLLDAHVCLYTNTPDHHFLLDAHPAHPQVLLVSPCSGHGFKFASAIGEVVADLATGGATRFDLRLFGVGRLRS